MAPPNNPDIVPPGDYGAVINIDDDPAEDFGVPEVTQTLCKDGVKAVFPDICLDYLERIASEHAYNSDAIIGTILDSQEKGEKYPVRPRHNPLKRKRVDDDDDDDNDNNDDDDDDDEKNENTGKDVKADQEKVSEEIRAKIAEPNYSQTLASPAYGRMGRNLIAMDFPRVPAITIRNYLLQHRQSVFEAYTAIDEATRNWNDENPPWCEKKTLSKKMTEFSPEELPNLDMTRFSLEEQAAIAELGAARELKSIKDAKVAAEAEEENNFIHEKSIGQVTECGCCFEEFALNRMIQCNGEEIHWFCRGCMRTQAETNIGLSKHELTCMSMDGCSAGFSLAQRNLFLDKRSRIALERIEQEAALRMAGIENLETCPFCPYAAEYPPVEVDKEFRCVNPGCEKVSCRLCRKETHIPKTCAESAADHGLDARHVLEEAMSAALIRTCNQCKNPFLKSDGCNKVRCTRCGTIHCYVCRKTITDYRHFNDVSRGGKNGRCPLYDSTEERHQEEVQRAEEETRQKVARDNPEIAVDALKIKVSDGVQQDELKRKQNDSRYRAGVAYIPPPPPPPPNGVDYHNIPIGLFGNINPQIGPHGPIPAPPAPGVPPVVPVPVAEVVPRLLPEARRAAFARRNRGGANMPPPDPVNNFRMNIRNMQANMQAQIDQLQAMRALIDQRKAAIGNLQGGRPAPLPPARIPPHLGQRLLVTLQQRQRPPQVPEPLGDLPIVRPNAPPYDAINDNGNPVRRARP